MQPADLYKFRVLRAGIARQSREVNRNPGDADARAELDRLRREYRIALVAEHIKSLVSNAPPLSDEQRNRLSCLLRPTG
jgi:hypothetical protein